MSEVTINVSIESTQEQFNAVCKHVEHEQHHNINMQPFCLKVEWGEFTNLVADDEGNGDLLKLFTEIQNILN